MSERKIAPEPKLGIKSENQLRFESEELECVNQYLDDLGIPRLHPVDIWGANLSDLDRQLSTVGRIRTLVVLLSTRKLSFDILEKEEKKFDGATRKLMDISIKKSRSS